MNKAQHAQPEAPHSLSTEELMTMPIAELHNYKLRAIWHAIQTEEPTQYDGMWDAAIAETKRRRKEGH